VRKSNYRLDIDGLRFVAVFIVILNHYSWGFSGGFVGVDVFFVISGFVITNQIYKAMENNEFSFLDFWYRRIKRISPAMLFMLFIVGATFTFVLSPNDAIVFYKNIIANILSLSNFYIWREYGGYFSGLAKEAPLLHTWSLAVEEQFYIFWPVILYFLVKIKNIKLFSIISLTMILLSVLFSQFGTERAITASYFLLPTRFFELIFGCFLSILMLKSEVDFNRNVKNVMSFIGLSFILYSSLFFNERTEFPGYNALVPVLGTVLFILSNGSFLNALLSNRHLNYLGQMSYSLYLWHWPAITLLVYIESDTFLNKILSLFIVFLMSFISLNFIENPIKESKKINKKHLLLFGFFIPSLLAIIISWIGIYTNGFDQRFNEYENTVFKAMTSDNNERKCLSGHRSYNRALSSECSFGNGEISVLLIGDSHANHLRGFFENMSEKNGNVKITEYTLDSCHPIFDLTHGNRNKPMVATTCRIRNDITKEIISKSDFDFVILAANWPTKTPFVYESRMNDMLSEYKSGLLNTIRYIKKSGAEVIIMEDTPGTGDLDFNCPVKRLMANDDRSCVANVDKNGMSYFPSILEGMEEKESFYRYNISQLICDGSKCKLEINGTPIYKDNGHLNKVGSELLSELFIKDSGNLFDLL